VLVVAIVVVIGVTLKSREVDQNSSRSIGAQQASSQYTTTVSDDGTIVAGKNDAKVKIDVYEDFLCPACGQFEARDKDKSAGDRGRKLQVNYHIVNLLDKQLGPGGYSSQAGKRRHRGGQGGKFADYHARPVRPRTSRGQGGLAMTSSPTSDCGWESPTPVRQ